MAKTTIKVEEHPALFATKLEHPPTFWCSWMLSRTHLFPALKSPLIQKDLNQCGVYLLVADTNNGFYNVYVGESENIATRLKYHYKEPPFPWAVALVFTNSTGYLEKSHIRYLEKAIYNKLSISPKSIIKNENVPGGAHVNNEEILDDFVDIITKFTIHCGFRGIFDSQTLPPVSSSTTVAQPDVPFKVGVIMRTAFRKAFSKGFLSKEDISELLDIKSADTFKLNKKLPLLIIDNLKPEFKIRYYRDPVIYKGKTYYISKEFLARSKAIVLSYLISRGMQIDEINKACRELQVHHCLQNSKTHGKQDTFESPIPPKESPCTQDNVVFPYKIGRVMLFAFSAALSRGLFSSKEITYLLSKESAKDFKTRGYPVLASESYPRIDLHGINRYAKHSIECRGERYWITTQVYKEGLQSVLSYLNTHGMSNVEIIELCKKGEMEREQKRKQKQNRRDI